jgi:hypothetical protein
MSKTYNNASKTTIMWVEITEEIFYDKGALKCLS